MSTLLRGTGPLAALAGACLAQAAPLVVEARPLDRTAYVGERVSVALRIAYDTAYFAEHGVPLLQRPMDVPFCLQPAADGGGETLEWRDAEGGVRVALGDREVLGERGADERPSGARWSVVVLAGTWEPTAPGLVELRLPRVRYAYTTRYETTWLGGRQPVDRHEAEAAAGDLKVQVRPIPETGRPAGFSGAVGEFHAVARAPEVVELGDSFALELEVSGVGNLSAFDAPPWPELPGFAVQGLAERRSPAARAFVFDVLALRLGAALPPVEFAFFDPGRDRFETITARCATRVVERREDRPLSPRVRRLLEQARAEIAPAGSWWWAALTGVLGLGVLGLLWARARR